MRNRIAALPALLCVLLFALTQCGNKSQTGRPGPMQNYDASAHYKNLEGDPASMPIAYRKNLESIKRALTGASPVKHKKIVRISDEDVRTVLRVSFETLPVDGKHLILSASLESLEFSEGTSCTAGPFKRQDSSEPYFDMVSVNVECSRHDSSKHHVISRTLYWNGAPRINEPSRPDGELRAQDAEISSE